MNPSGDLVIEEWIESQRVGRGSWKTVRQDHGSRNVARFGTLGAARRYAKTRFLAKARVLNQRTHSYEAL